MKDHPHAYGDKLDAKQDGLYTPGSSPRVWGQAAHPWLAPNVSRIIPTRMGTRSVYCTPNNYRGDHPHAYGDKDF